MQTLELLRPKVFGAVPGIVAGFTTRHGGVSPAPFGTLNLGLSTDDDDVHVQANRRRLAQTLGFAPDAWGVAGQVHGSDILEIDEPGLYPGYDGLITRVPGLLLGITAADCAAILLADAEAQMIGACHSGWRGTVARITEKTVAAMCERGAEPSRLRAYVSPCISMEHFEVGPEVAAQFEDAFVHYLPGKEKPRVDLKAAIAAQLRAAGVPAEHVEVAPFCTVADRARFFSYRAENGQTGRMMGFVGMASSE